MTFRRAFTLKEAKSCIPKLKNLIINVNQQLDFYLQQIENLQKEYHDIAHKLGLENIEISSCRLDLNYSGQNDLNDLYNEIMTIENISKNLVIATVDDIMNDGIVLRDLRKGLVDFPAVDKNLLYYLCWQIDEDDIEWWHTRQESFINRKKIQSLIEFI